jgi:hypothetical protein
MNAKLIFSTDTEDIEHWIDLPFIPRISEWINVMEILKKEEILAILQTASCWSGARGTIQSVEYRHINNDFYAEIYVWCED